MRCIGLVVQWAVEEFKYALRCSMIHHQETRAGPSVAGGGSGWGPPGRCYYSRLFSASKPRIIAVPDEKTLHFHVTLRYQFEGDLLHTSHEALKRAMTEQTDS